MMFGAHASAGNRGVGSLAGFTLAEVLAALLFMAIVIPVTVQAVRVASLAGQVGERRAAAARLADRLMSEMLAMGTIQSGPQSGTMVEGAREYRWVLQSAPWSQDSLTEFTMKVYFQVQGTVYDAVVSTLADPEKLSQAGMTTGGGS